MLKKMLPLVILIAGGFYFLNGSNNFLKTKSEVKQNSKSKNKKILRSEIAVDKASLSIKSDNKDSISFKDLHDSQVDVAQRIKLIEANIKKWNRAETLQLEKFINSKNPYKENSKDPHSFTEVRMNEEAALRVHAMRRLAENLSEDRFYEVFERISRSAQDPQIRLVAKETIRYKKNGKSLHEEVINGVGSLPIPD